MPKNIIYPSLKTFEFNPVAFQAAEYTPVERKSNVLLQRSLEQKQAARLSANSQLDKIRLDADKLRSTISPDAKTQQWFTDYTNRRINDIQAEMDSGNYNHAVELAGKLGSEFMGTQIQGRQQAFTDWKTADDVYQKAVLSGTYNARDLNYWRKDNPVNYTPAIDADGNERTDIIGTWTKPNELLAPVDWERLITTAAQGPAYDQHTSGGHTKSDGSSTGSSSYNRLTKKRIRDYFTELIQDDTVRRQIQQDWEYSRRELDELEAQLPNLSNSPDDQNVRNRYNELVKLLRPDGSTTVGWETYAMNVAGDRLDAHAYNRRSTAHISEAPEKQTSTYPMYVGGQGNKNNIVQVGTTPFGVPVLHYDGSNYTKDVSGNLVRYTGTINSFDWGE